MTGLRSLPRLNSWVPALVLSIIIFAGIIKFPLNVVTDNHDEASQAALEYWTQHHFQYGSQIVQNVGPLGFLLYPGVYTGFLDTEKFYLGCVFTVLFSFLVAQQLMREKSTVLTAAFLSCLVFLFITPDAFYYLLAFFVGRRVLAQTPRAGERFYLLPALAVLAFSKGTFLFIFIALLLLKIISALFRRQYAWLYIDFPIALAAFVLTWVASGQDVTHLTSFVSAEFRFSSGYNEAMGQVEPDQVKAFGLACLTFYVILAALHLKSLRLLRPLIPALSCLAFEAFLVLVAWKHGFVRADIHVVIFFGFFAVLSIFLSKRAINSLTSHGRARAVRIWLLIGAQLLILLMCYAATECVSPGFLAANWQMRKTEFRFATQPRSELADFQTRLQASAKSMLLPNIDKAVGEASVGYFGWFPAPMVYNPIRYSPAPSTISFAAWNDSIMKADQQYYAKPDRAPTYLIATVSTIDGRLVAQDDSLAQLEILKRYSPVLTEGPRLLLKRNDEVGEIGFEKISELNDVDLDQPVVLPPGRAPLWIKISSRARLRGRLVEIFYKPSIYSIQLKFKDGHTDQLRFMPLMAETGFLINPLISNNEDLEKVISDPLAPAVYGSDHNEVAELRLHCAWQELTCHNRMHVEFYHVKNLLPAWTKEGS